MVISKELKIKFSKIYVDECIAGDYRIESESEDKYEYSLLYNKTEYVGYDCRGFLDKSFTKATVDSCVKVTFRDGIN